MLVHLAGAFSLSKGGHKCEDDCPKACHHVDYETSLTYAKLQRNVFVEQFLSFLNATPESPVSTSLYEVYLPLLNMTRSERQEYIELVQTWSIGMIQDLRCLPFPNNTNIFLEKQQARSLILFLNYVQTKITGSPRAVIQVISCGLCSGTQLKPAWTELFQFEATINL